MLSIFANPIIDIFKLENDVHKYALDFFNIFSFFSITFALNTLLSGIFRSFGYTKVPMVINMVAMGLNALGNYCYIFGKFGFPILAVKGVAISSVVSQGIAALAMFTLLKKYHIPFNFKVILKVPIEVYKNILKIGVPNGLETLSFSVTQIVMMGFISNLGTNSLAAYNYTFSIQRIILIFSLSIGQATEIMIGYLVGAKKKFYAYKLVYKNLIIAFSIAAFTSIIVILLRNSLIPIFTKNDDIIQITKTLLLFAFVLETGRTFNMTFIMALKGSGVVNFPLIIGLFSMWIIGVLFSYWLGFVISIGITGIWIAISSDEWFRGIVMYFRWRSKKWMDKSLSD
jgi:putative MATE family efflux protein